MILVCVCVYAVAYAPEKRSAFLFFVDCEFHVLSTLPIAAPIYIFNLPWAYMYSPFWVHVHARPLAVANSYTIILANRRQAPRETRHVSLFTTRIKTNSNIDNKDNGAPGNRRSTVGVSVGTI